MAKRITFICDICGQHAEKEKRHYDENIKNGRKNCCSTSCRGKCRKNNRGGAPRKDPLLVSLKRLLTTSKQVSIRKKYNFDLTLEYLVDLWHKQNGRCYITNVAMVSNVRPWHGKYKQDPRQVSIDRINPNEGYIQGNIALACATVNFGKNAFSIEQMREFYQLVKTS